jgi:hypothetical protein
MVGMNPHPYDAPGIDETWTISATKIALGFAIAVIGSISVYMAIGKADPLLLLLSTVEHVLMFGGGVYCGCACWQRSRQNSP